MIKPFGPYTLTAGVLQPVVTGQYPQANVAVFINESPFTLRVDPGTGSYYIISAFTQDKIILGSQYSGMLMVSPVADIMVTGSPPVSVLYVLTASASAELPGMYPAALTRLANIGNTVTTGGSVNSINNQNETPPIDVIFDQPTGYSSPSIHLIDTGEMHLAPKGNASQADALAVIPGGGAGIYAIVQMDNNLINTDGKGKFAVTLLSLLGSATPPTMGNDSSGRIQFKTAAAERALIDALGLKLGGLGGKIQAWSGFVGSATGTYSHNLGTPPNIILCQAKVSGSQTMGWDTPTATTVHITSGAGLSWQGLAILLN